MGRGGKDVIKRASGRKRIYWGNDEDDEEYVAEEEENSHESGSSDEESLDASDADDSASSAEVEEEKPYSKVKSRRNYASGRRRLRASNYDEWEDDDYDDDEDFTPDANDEDDEDDSEEDSLVLGDIGVSTMESDFKKQRKLKRSVSKAKVNKRSRKVDGSPRKTKRRKMVACSYDENNFISVKNHRKDLKKVNKRTSKSMSAKKNKSSIDAYSFDSDYLMSDDDPLPNRVATNNPRNKKKGNFGRKKGSFGRKKISKEDCETSDSDFVVSDEEILDNDCLGFTRSRNSSRHKRKNEQMSKKQVFVESKYSVSNDEICNEADVLKTGRRSSNVQKLEGVLEGKKGKEKEVDDSGKQFCGICLSEEHDGTIQGSLNCCSHYFCFACILEWSKVESRCPLCKRRFVTITKLLKSDSMLQVRKHVIRVQMRDQVYKPSDEELRVLLDPYEDVVCMECHQGGDDSLMLLCDICDSSAHTYCVGLGDKVPEGNWYCDCCNLGGEESAAALCGVEKNGSNPQSSSIFQHSVFSRGQSSSSGSDLNAPPRRNYMDGSAVAASQAPGVWASTLSRRRSAHQRVRFFFNSDRQGRRPAVSNRADIDNGALEQNEERFQPESRRDFPHWGSNVVRRVSNNGRRFRRVVGAKKQVQSMVKHYLRLLSMDIPLECSTLKEITMNATHTILASCGIHHARSLVRSFYEPPKDCSHDLDGGPVFLVTGCCSSCFSDYAKHVVKVLAEAL